MVQLSPVFMSELAHKKEGKNKELAHNLVLWYWARIYMIYMIYFFND